MKFTLKDVVRLLVLIVCGTVLGVNVYLANAKNLVGNQMPMPFGYGAAVVLSGSMEPVYSVGDLILVKETESVNVDEIVVYQSGSSLVVHRVVEINEDMVTTQGDANNVADDPIASSAIKGVVFLCIPAVGTFVNYLKTPLGIIITIALAILLVEIPNRLEKSKDDDETQRLIDEINELKKEIYDK